MGLNKATGGDGIPGELFQILKDDAVKVLHSACQQIWKPHLETRADSLEKTLMQGKIEGRRRGMTEDEMVGWHHRLNGHESEQTLGGREGQGSLVCCSPRGRKESDTTGVTEQQRDG